MADAEAGRASKWSAPLGVILIIVGVVAMITPLFTTLTLIKVMGWLLMVAAIEQAVHAFQHRAEEGLSYKVILAVLYGIVAVMLLRAPVSGAAAATVIIAILFLLDGITEMALVISARREGRKSGLLFAGGLMALLFAGIILYSFPLSALWTIGLLVGVRLIFKGIEQITSTLPRTRPGIDRPGDVRRAA